MVDHLREKATRTLCVANLKQTRQKWIPRDRNEGVGCLGAGEKLIIEVPLGKQPCKQSN
jgi:hypothetical protein